jgi:putative transcriptional regulator
MRIILDKMYAILYLMFSKHDNTGGGLSNFVLKIIIVNRIHVLRAERRITQQQLADAVGVTRGTIIALEKGSYNPSLELAFRLSVYFNTDINSIFKIEEDTNEKD